MASYGNSRRRARQAGVTIMDRGARWTLGGTAIPARGRSCVPWRSFTRSVAVAFRSAERVCDSAAVRAASDGDAALTARALPSLGL